MEILNIKNIHKNKEVQVYFGVEGEKTKIFIVSAYLKKYPEKK